MESYKSLISKVEELKVDAEKFFEQENKSAGTRLRKGLQEVKVLCNAIRTEVQEKKKK